MMLLGSCGLCVSMIFACVIFAHAARQNINQMFFSGDYADDEPHICRHVSVTFIFCALAVVVTCAVRDISEVLAFLGSTTNPIICYILPAIFYIRVMPKGKHRLNKFISGSMGIFFGAVGTACVVKQFHDRVNN